MESLLYKSVLWSCTPIVGIPTSVGMTASVLYTMANGVSPVKERFVVLYAHNTFSNSSAHFPLLCSRFFLIMFRMALFVASACPLLCGYDRSKIQLNVISVIELLLLTILKLSSIVCH